VVGIEGEVIAASICVIFRELEGDRVFDRAIVSIFLKLKDINALLPRLWMESVLILKQISGIKNS
jgi:hypothetical protein